MTTTKGSVRRIAPLLRRAGRHAWNTETSRFELQDTHGDAIATWVPELEELQGELADALAEEIFATAQGAANDLGTSHETKLVRYLGDEPTVQYPMRHRPDTDVADRLDPSTHGQVEMYMRHVNELLKQTTATMAKQQEGLLKALERAERTNERMAKSQEKLLDEREKTAEAYLALISLASDEERSAEQAEAEARRAEKLTDVTTSIVIPQLLPRVMKLLDKLEGSDGAKEEPKGPSLVKKGGGDAA